MIHADLLSSCKIWPTVAPMARTRVSLPFSGANLRTLRELRGLRQKDLSDRTAETGCRVWQGQISAYENGESFPNAMTFGALVRALGCEPGELLDATKAGAA